MASNSARAYGKGTVSVRVKRAGEDDWMTHNEVIWRQRGEALRRKLKWLFTRTKAQKS